MSTTRGTSGFVESETAVYINRYPFCKFFSYIRTAFGIITVFILFSAALSSLITIVSIPVAIYLGVIAIPVFLLEFGKIIRMCCGTNGALCNVFSLVLDFDRWKRGLFYATLSIPCFFKSISNTSSEVAGLFLFICGVLYVAKVFQKKKVTAFVADPNSSLGTTPAVNARP
ncbi:hypothetical protein M3Y94_00173600 [Aphelenchoides besseyi]|nr:hypothetical protein M3Y94_00173600 [Aphelenchoides besseyi]KAI6236951.1 hypothetical protein M3Y95_00213600 [Aphelenchoides besseyi]